MEFGAKVERITLEKKKDTFHLPGLKVEGTRQGCRCVVLSMADDGGDGYGDHWAPSESTVLQSVLHQSTEQVAERGRAASTPD